MLDGFERNDGVDGRILQRQQPRVSSNETKIGVAVSLGGVDDCLGGSLDARHGPGRLRQQSSAVSLARSDVEYVETAAPSTCEKVAMEVLDLNLPEESSCQTLPRPLKGLLRYCSLKISPTCLTSTAA